MLCKVCNTRVAPGRHACPNCGSNSLIDTRTNKSATNARLPHMVFAASEEPEVAGLEDAVEPAVPEEVDAMTDPMHEIETEDIIEPSTRYASKTEEKDDPPEVLDLIEAAHEGGPLSPDADAVRELLIARPNLLEPGLTLYTSEKGTPQGAGYTSAVGPIDLLAWDASGGLVVVMIAGDDEGPELVSGVLQRIGWVSKHLRGAEQRVRGIVVLEHMNDSIAYAAAAVAQTITFKTWRFALTFSDIES